MNRKIVGVAVLTLAAILMTLQTCSRNGAFAADAPSNIDKIKVLGIGLGFGNEQQANNYSSISGTEIKEINANHASEILNRLAGFNIQHGSGQEHLTAIRSPVLTGGAGAGSFLFLEDNVPLRAAGFGNVNGLFEAVTELAGNIEAARGPSSTLFGSNAVHGAVNVKSRAPTFTQQNNALVRFGLNPFLAKFIASTSNRVGTNAAARLGISYLRNDGWRNSTGVEQFKTQIRLDNTFGAVQSKTLLSAHNLDQETGGYLTDRATGKDFSYKFRNLTFTNANPDAYRRVSGVRTQNNLLWKIKKNQQLDLTSWFRWTRMNFLMHFLPTSPVEKNAHFSFGVRPIWLYQFNFWGKRSFNIGMKFEYTHGTLSEVQDQPDRFSFFQGTHYDYAIDAYTIALFSQHDWIFPDENTTIYFGMRSEWTRYDYDNKTESGTHNDSTEVSALYRPADRIHDFFTVTPKVGVNYRLPKLGKHQIYTFSNYTWGARAPQTTDLYRLRYRDRNASFKSERLANAEAGFRGKQNAIHWQIVGFYMYKSNYHFRDSSFEPVLNGKTNHAGLEVEFFTPLPYGLSVKGAFTYARHWYAFNNADRGIKKNKDIDTAPRLLLNTELAYTHERGRLAIEYIRVGKYYTEPTNRFSYKGHSLLNLRSSLRVWQDIHVFFNIFNLADVRYADRADYFTNPRNDDDNTRRYFPGQPRAYYIGLKADF